MLFKTEVTELCGTDHGDPQDYVLVYEAVEVLVEEEEAGADEGRVREVQLALGHVRYLQRSRGTDYTRLITRHTPEIDKTGR